MGRKVTRREAYQSCFADVIKRGELVKYFEHHGSSEKEILS